MRGLAVVFALGATACGGDGKATDGDDFPRACDASAVDGDCVLFSGTGWTAGDVQENCAEGGTLLPDCPPDASVGSCTLDPGEFETVTTLYTPYWNGTQAIDDCNDRGGTFDEP